MFFLACLALITVEGHVFDSVTKEPIAEARVVLVAAGQPWGYHTWTTPPTPNYSPTDPIISLRSDEHGAFRFRIEAPTKLRLLASKDGYVFNNEQNFDLVDDRTDIRLALIPEAVVAGRAIDVETGQPVSDLSVTAYAYQKTGAGQSLLFQPHTSQTDGEGHYRLDKLPPGEYLIEARPHLGVSFRQPKKVADFAADIRLNYARTWHPGVATVLEAAPVTVLTAGRVDGIDIKLARRPVAAIRGRIGTPTAVGEIIVVLNTLTREVQAQSVSIVARGTMKSGEAFEAENLLPGNYWLTAHTPGPPENRLACSHLFEVDDQNIDLGEIVLRPGVTVTGRVRVEGVDHAPPFDSMVVHLTSPLRMSMGEKPVQVEPATGHFTLRGFQPEAYVVRLARVPKGFKAREVRYNGAHATHDIICLDPLAQRHDLEITLAPATSSGKVFHARGAHTLPCQLANRASAI
ncbi:MAG: carboxypeptidase-like regulatory domain-containing protein, partial [Acidobacteria bacterium]|nr:carboxypeptidase-like regulatory domain-containing protein [Acidobacteriota bacterium]